MTERIDDYDFQLQFTNYIDTFTYDRDVENSFISYAARKPVQITHECEDIGTVISTTCSDYWPGANHDGTLSYWKNPETHRVAMYTNTVRVSPTEVASAAIFAAFYRQHDMNKHIHTGFDKIRNAYALSHPDPSATLEERINAAAQLLCYQLPLSVHELVEITHNRLRTNVSLLWFDGSYRTYQLLFNHAGRLRDLKDTTADSYPNALHHIFPLYLNPFASVIPEPSMADYYSLCPA